MVHIYNGILLTIKRNKIGPFIETWVDEDSVLRREVIQRDVESRKMVLMNLIAGQEKRCRHGEETCGHMEGRKGWDKLRE